MDQLRELGQHYDVTLLVNYEASALQTEIGANVRVIRVGMERKINLWSDIQALLELFAIFHRERFDLVHSVSPKAGLLSMVAAWLCRVPVRIHTFQGEVWAVRKGFMRAMLRFFDRLTAFFATCLLVVGDGERQFLINEAIIPADKSRVLAKGSISGIDTVRFSPLEPAQRSLLRRQAGIAESDVLFLYLGRLALDKGILDLVQAYNHVQHQYPQARLMIVGPDEDDVLTRLNKSCLDARSTVIIHGYTSEPERYMQMADVVCLPSYREGFNTVLLEAAAVRVATMASCIYGTIDAVDDGVTGLLHPPADVPAIESVMLQLLRNSALRERLAEAGMRRARQDFSRQTVIKAFIAFYSEQLTDPLCEKS